MEITTEELKQKIENGTKLIVDFHGLWCGPCKIMKPTFEKVAQQMRNSNSEVELYTMYIVTGKQIGRASWRERV